VSAKGIGNRVGAIALIGIAVASVTLLGLRSREPTVTPPPPGEEEIVVVPPVDEPPVDDEPPLVVIKRFTQSVASGVAPLTVGYTIDPADPRAEIIWNFGDGSPNVLNNKVENHSYFSAGTFNGFVDVIDSNSNSERINFSVVVSAPAPPPPTQQVIISNFFQDRSVIMKDGFVSFSIALGVVPRLIIWDFGDGSNRVLNQTSLDHQYRQVGTFGGFVQVEDEFGFTETRNFTVVVTQSQTVIDARIDLGPESGAVLEPNEDITLRANVGGGVPPFVNFEWDFGDGTRASGPESIVVHRYAQPGIVSVIMTVTDSVGQTDTATRVLNIEERSIQFGDATVVINASSGTFDYRISVTNTRNDIAIDGRLLIRIFDAPGFGSQQYLSRTDQIFLQPGATITSNLILPTSLPPNQPLVLDAEYKSNVTQRQIARDFVQISVTSNTPPRMDSTNARTIALQIQSGVFQFTVPDFFRDSNTEFFLAGQITQTDYINGYNNLLDRGIIF